MISSVRTTAVVAVLLALATSAQAQPAKRKKPETKAEIVVRLTNEFRKSKGLPPLTVNEKLEKAAQKHAENMARTGRFSHNLDGKSPLDRMRDEGYMGFGGENIQVNPSTAPATVAVGSWKNSPGHRANMLRESFKEIGVGVARSKSGMWYFCQVFGAGKFAGKFPGKFVVGDGLICELSNRSGKAVTIRIKGLSRGSEVRAGLTTKLLFATKARSIVVEVVPKEASAEPVEVTFRQGMKYVIERDADGVYKVEEVTPAKKSPAPKKKPSD
jgi:uncharacterized protein YkwD